MNRTTVRRRITRIAAAAGTLGSLWFAAAAPFFQGASGSSGKWQCLLASAKSSSPAQMQAPSEHRASMHPRHADPSPRRCCRVACRNG